MTSTSIDFFRIGLRKLRKRPDLNSCAAKSGWLRISWNLVWVYSNACQLWMNLLQLSEYSLPSTWVYTIRNSSLNSIKNINRILSTRSSFFFLNQNFWVLNFDSWNFIWKMKLKSFKINNWKYTKLNYLQTKLKLSEQNINSRFKYRPENFSWIRLLSGLWFTITKKTILTLTHLSTKKNKSL